MCLSSPLLLSARRSLTPAALPATLPFLLNHHKQDAPFT